MGTIKLSGIIERYNEAFGITAQKVAPRIVQLAGMGGVNINLPGLDVYGDADETFGNVKFTNSISGDEYKFGINTQLNKALPFFKFSSSDNSQGYLAPPPMVSFRREKHVVRTAIERSGFDVIENFGLKPFEIRMQGIIIDYEDHNYPQKLLKKVNAMFEASGTYAVVGTIFNDLGIDEVFFESGFEVSFVEGFIDTVKYRVNAISTSSANFLVQKQ